MREVDKIQQDEFSRMLYEAKTLQKKEKKNYTRIRNKPILINRVVQLYVSGNYSNSQIASIMGVSVQVINKLLKEQEVLDMILEYQNEEKEYVDSRLKSLRQKSLDTIFELLDSVDDSVRLNASKEVLDRTGHVKKDIKDVNINVSYEEKLKELGDSIDLSYIDTSYTVINDNEQNNEEGVVNGD